MVDWIPLEDGFMSSIGRTSTRRGWMGRLLCGGLALAFTRQLPAAAPAVNDDLEVDADNDAVERAAEFHKTTCLAVDAYRKRNSGQDSHDLLWFRDRALQEYHRAVRHRAKARSWL